LTGKPLVAQKHARWRRFLPAEKPISGERIRLTKIFRRSENSEPDEGLFRAEIEFGDAPRYDQKDNPDGPRQRRNCSMLWK
jgi:hypothetical protein